jgi:GR25 family glycosyltransferase involved in LPS biosynthesis
VNPLKTPLAPKRLLYELALKSRELLPRQQSRAFGRTNETGRHRIGSIYVINLDRQHDRWARMCKELTLVLDAERLPLADRAIRQTAVDARTIELLRPTEYDVVPFYTLRDQLLVEPQPFAMPDRVELDRPIRMSQPELAVACSHISVWREIVACEQDYAVVLEDDVAFSTGFARYLDRAWAELLGDPAHEQIFDILYLSYIEVKGGAPKVFTSPNVFRPMRGLWCLSGYVLSRKGAERLLNLLPCRGPVDLWLNHQFANLNVRATRRSIITQRIDGTSTNSYSILPALTRIGVLKCRGESLFQIRPRERPVIAFGSENSGLSSLAMALSMLGYRCCSDVEDLPRPELERLLTGRSDRVFDAYVNVGSLNEKVGILHNLYLHAKFIVATRNGTEMDPVASAILARLADLSVAVLPADAPDKWKLLCEHLRCAPPDSTFPEFPDLGQRNLVSKNADRPNVSAKRLKWDKSPWVIEEPEWRGVRSKAPPGIRSADSTRLAFTDTFCRPDPERWVLRDDTFGSNLAMFRPSNVEFDSSRGALLRVKEESLGVRNYSAGAISSAERFLYGRFEALLQATRLPGVVTGFFLHRDTPRQEIDIEIVGGRPDSLLVNVFYNPGGEGANFDYGYRGAPTRIMLGFDASASLHSYVIEWDPSMIRWFVDEQIVHERGNWEPTPIPHLPMTLHVNAWPSRSSELAGRLARRSLPATVLIRSISVEAGSVDNQFERVQAYQRPGHLATSQPCCT